MLILIASSDDYLLEESLHEAVAAACQSMGGIEPEHLPEEVSPESLALEVNSLSLFNPQRVLTVPDIGAWLDAPAPAGAGRRTGTVKVDPLVEALAGGVGDDLALVLGAWCGDRPKGKLAKAIEEHGELRWIALPPPPKPWEEVTLSEQQRAVLRGVVKRAAPGIRLTPEAAALLLERLGFAPRLLAQESQKLATAAGEGATIDEELVRALTFPRERSLEVVRDAVLERDHKALLDLIAAAAGGVPVRDWRGQSLDSGSLPIALFAQAASLLEQMLYLRGLTARAGYEAELDSSKIDRRFWYQRFFKERLAPELSGHMKQDPDAPITGRSASPWSLSQIFAGAARYHDDELIAALVAAGQVEADLRGPLALEAVSAWLTSLMETKPRTT